MVKQSGTSVVIAVLTVLVVLLAVSLIYVTVFSDTDGSSRFSRLDRDRLDRADRDRSDVRDRSDQLPDGSDNYPSSGQCRPAIWKDPVLEEPAGTTYGTFFSDTLTADGEEVGEGSYLIYLPPSYETSNDEYPVLYWLHGGGGNQRKGAHFVELLDQQISDGKVPEMIVVLVTGLQSLYVNSHPDAPVSIPMESVIMNDLIPHIDSTYRTIDSREGRGIEGFSMGGFGATHLGFKYPETFGVVSNLAGALVMPIPGTAIPCTFVTEDYFVEQHPTTIVEENADLIRGRTFVRVIVGDSDNGRGTLDANQDFHDLLTELDIEHSMTLVPGVSHCYECLYDELGDEAFVFFNEAFGDLE